MSPVPRYSADTSAAMEVVETMRENGFVVAAKSLVRGSLTRNAVVLILQR